MAHAPADIPQAGIASLSLMGRGRGATLRLRGGAVNGSEPDWLDYASSRRGRGLRYRIDAPRVPSSTYEIAANKGAATAINTSA